MRIDGRLSASNALSPYFSYDPCPAKGQPVERCFRDINACIAHFLTGEQSLIDTGKVLAVKGAALALCARQAMLGLAYPSTS